MPKFQPTHMIVIRGEAIPVKIWAVGAVAYYFIEGEEDAGVGPSTFKILAEGPLAGKILRHNIPVEDSRLAIYGKPERVIRIKFFDWHGDEPDVEEWSNTMKPFGVFVYSVRSNATSDYCLLFSNEKLTQREAQAEYKSYLS